ncbi:hypothetical protein BH10ACI4_BH10ACI4_25120 [soil metagenome]
MATIYGVDFGEDAGLTQQLMDLISPSNSDNFYGGSKDNQKIKGACIPRLGTRKKAFGVFMRIQPGVEGVYIIWPKAFRVGDPTRILLTKRNLKIMAEKAMKYRTLKAVRTRGSERVEPDGKGTLQGGFPETNRRRF